MKFVITGMRAFEDSNKNRMVLVDFQGIPALGHNVGFSIPLGRAQVIELLIGDEFTFDIDKKA